jgi:hypothetical protein
MKEIDQGRPPGEPKKEQGRGQGESKECQTLPSVWDLLERKVRLNAKDVTDRPRWGSQEYEREFDELNRLQNEQRKKGAPRAKLINDLFYTISVEPTGTQSCPI